MFPKIPPGGHRMVLNDKVSPVRALFTDGTVVKGRVAAGAAVARIDAHGVCSEPAFVQGWCVAQPSRDSTYAELQALKLALQWLLTLEHCGPTLVFTDSYQLLEHLAKQSSRYEDLQCLPELFEAVGVVELRNLDRSQNKCADALARQAMSARRPVLFADS